MHKCIVSLVAYTVAPCSMVLEYMPNGNLYSHLRSRTDLTWQIKLKMAINIADAMTFLHSQKPKVSFLNIQCVGHQHSSHLFFILKICHFDACCIYVIGTLNLQIF